jgi:hypothetical protein
MKPIKKINHEFARIEDKNRIVVRGKTKTGNNVPD